MEMGKAISQKIREAIRAKLIDLGNYVDEELPDYIMVMVANKKAEAQMKDDLTLFLGANTDKFCGWLQGVLTKLQAARNEQKEKKDKAKEKKKKGKKKDDKKEKKRRSSGEKKEEKKSAGVSSSMQDDGEGADKVSMATVHAEIAAKSEATEQSAGPSQSVQDSKNIAVEAPTQQAPAVSAEVTTQQAASSTDPVISLLPDTNDFLDEEIKMSESVKKLSANVVKSKPEMRKEAVPKTVEKFPEKETPKQTATKTSPQSTVSRPRRRSPPVTVTIRAEDRRVQEVAHRGSVKSRLGVPAAKRRAEEEESPRVLTRMSTVVRVPIVEAKRFGPESVIGQVIQDEEESDEEPPVKRVASTIKPRRRPPLPKSKQNSMALLKKAMSQAQESTSVFPAAGQFAEPVRMIVKSASQPGGSMKIVARSIPADRETTIYQQSIVHPGRKKLLATAVRAASHSVAATKPIEAKASVSVKPLGLMSRSRFKEANERNFDAHDYQRVASKEAKEEEEEVRRKEEEEEEEVEEEEEEKEGVEEAESTVREEKEVVKEEVIKEESIEDEEELEGERQIIEIRKEVEKVVEEEVRTVEYESPAVEEEREIETQEPVYDTRTTEIVRPLQFNRLSALQKRASQPQPQVVQPLAETEDINPRFFVTLEGKKRKPPPQVPQHNIHISPPQQPSQALHNLPQYNPTPIPLLSPRSAALLSGYEPEEEMEEEVLEEKYFEMETTGAMHYQQVTLTDRIPMPMFENEAPMEMLVPPQQTVAKETVFSPPQPKIEPIAFSLHESDEDQGQAEMDETINERCKFWPACKNGSECPYAHPSTPCKTFPNCKFGDKCLFIHPNCKFDASCMNPSCPFTHATRTKPAPIIIQAPPVRAMPSFKPNASKTICRFHPRCTNTSCPFFHPKMCRYNTSCTRPDCKFTHSAKTPARSAMKWTKNQHISERKFVSKPPTQPL